MSLPPGRDEAERQRIRQALARIAAGRARVASDTKRDKIDRIGDKRLEQAAEQAAVANDWLLIELRKTYRRNLIRFMWIYFCVTFTLIVANAFHIYGIDIDKSILVAAIGGTAVSVLGVVGTIASGLFKPPEKNDVVMVLSSL